MSEPGPTLATYRRGRLRVAECWLDQPVERPVGCDLLLLHQYSKAPPDAFSSPFTTLTLDLTQSEDLLLQGLNRDTKYKVRRAESKDAVECVLVEPRDMDAAREFTDFFDEFATGKGVARIDAAELQARVAAGTVRFSRASWHGQVVVWHVHAVTSTHASLLHSASHFRQADDNDTRAAIGRANRLLHWKDIAGFKAMGLAVYDFGGWYAGQEDDGLLRINQFKEGFGGRRTEQVNAALALSWKGWLYLRARQLLSPAQRKALKLRLQAWRAPRAPRPPA